MKNLGHTKAKKVIPIATVDQSIAAIVYTVLLGDDIMTNPG
jgi:hypothetical protein